MEGSEKVLRFLITQKPGGWPGFRVSMTSFGSGDLLHPTGKRPAYSAAMAPTLLVLAA